MMGFTPSTNPGGAAHNVADAWLGWAAGATLFVVFAMLIWVLGFKAMTSKKFEGVVLARSEMLESRVLGGSATVHRIVVVTDDGKALSLRVSYATFVTIGEGDRVRVQVSGTGSLVESPEVLARRGEQEVAR